MAKFVHLQPLFHADLHFHVLSALDLPNDAASLYSGLNRPWGEELRVAYLAAPGRLVVQGMPLIAEGLPELLDLLRGDRLAELRDPAGRRLGALLADVLESEAEERRAFWEKDLAAGRERARGLEAWLDDLEALQGELWKDGSKPALVVHDCPSLSTREGSRGRGVPRRGAVHVAVGLGGPLEQVLCQLLHEAVHAATDPPLRRAHAAARQDTRADGPAFSLHRELERAAVAEGERLVAGAMPRLRDAYRAWRRRHGC